MTRHAIERLVLLAWIFAVLDSTTVRSGSLQSAVPLIDAAQIVGVIQDYRDGLASVRSANPDVRLSVKADSGTGDERVLVVEYPTATGDPAGRDVRCTAEHQDWTSGRAVSFRIKPGHAMRLSLSFVDRNRVAYTAWIELTGSGWQVVRIPFDEMRPNPYFQPPDARTGAPLDVSEVKGIAFAPQDPISGRLEIGKFVVSN